MKIRVYCHLCEKSFSENRNLRHHMLKIHRKVVPNKRQTISEADKVKQTIGMIKTEMLEAFNALEIFF